MKVHEQVGKTSLNLVRNIILVLAPFSVHCPICLLSFYFPLLQSKQSYEQVTSLKIHFLYVKFATSSVGVPNKSMSINYVHSIIDNTSHKFCSSRGFTQSAHSDNHLNLVQNTADQHVNKQNCSAETQFMVSNTV